ncbi:phage tail protein [Sphingomonas sp.]|uniref:phage tail protein n=1 Tax=Sphingomonas sp. TaxID=28214 RepID=UPI003B3A1560
MGKVVKAVAAVGLVAAITVASGGIAGAFFAAGSIGFAVTTAVSAAVLSAAASVAFKALGLTAKIGPPSTTNATPTVYRQSVAASNIVYGKRRVGGLLTFFHARKIGNDHYRYFVVSVAGHRVKGVLRWFLGDEEVTVNPTTGAVTSGQYAGAAWLWFDRGADDAVANSTFVTECVGKWTSNHRGRGIAKFYAKFKMTDAAVQAGMPNMTCEIEGKDDILDPRTGVRGYTNNAALVFYDWMALPREEGGFGAYPDEIPDGSWIAAQANICDEQVPLIQGGTEARYTLNGVIVTGANPASVRDTLIVNCAGTFATIGGQFMMRPGYWVPPSATLVEDDLVGPIRVSAFTAGNEIATEIVGTYIEPTALYQSADFKSQAQPSADIRQMDLDLAFVTSRSRATRIGRIMLRRALAEKTVAWPMNVVGLKVQAMDTVQLATARYGLSNYTFTVTSWKPTPDFGFVLALREESPEIYDWDPSEAPALPPHVPIARTEPMPNIYPDGTPIGELRPAESGATKAVNGTNLIKMSLFERISGFWGIGYNPGGIVTGAPFAHDFKGKRLFSFTFNSPGSFASNNNYVASIIHPTTTLRFEVPLSGRLFFGFRPQTGGATMSAVLRFYGASGAPLPTQLEVTVPNGVDFVGDPANWPRYGGFIDLPSGAVRGEVEWYAYPVGAGSGLITICEPMVCPVSAGTTEWPIFVPGPNATDGADVTGENTALNSLNLGGRTAAEVNYELNAIGSNGVLDKGEKRAVKDRYNDTIAAYIAAYNRSLELNVAGAERDQAAIAISALNFYLGGLSPGWQDTGQDTPLDPNDWNSIWDTAFTRVAQLQAALAPPPGLQNAADSTNFSSFNSTSYAVVSTINMFIGPDTKTLRLVLGLNYQFTTPQASSSTPRFYVDAVVPGQGVVQLTGELVGSTTTRTGPDGEGQFADVAGALNAALNAANITLPLASYQQVTFRLYARKDAGVGTIALSQSRFRVAAR